MGIRDSHLFGNVPARRAGGDYHVRPIVAGRESRPGRAGLSLVSFLLQTRESRQSRERAGGHHEGVFRPQAGNAPSGRILPNPPRRSKPASPQFDSRLTANG